MITNATVDKNKHKKVRKNMLRYRWRWFYMKYIKVIISAVVAAIIEIVGELYVEKKRHG